MRRILALSLIAPASNQAVNELCPALIWQLRNSAAHYTGGPSVPS